jgi:mono/diheme cytochrome c family protein
MKKKTFCAAAVLAIMSGMQMLASGAGAETLLERVVACGNCHSSRGRDGKTIKGQEYSGGFKLETPGFTAYASNITPDKETGIGSWTDAQLIKAIREGKRPDGSTIGPPMPIPLYRGMSDRDVKAIVAFLRTLKPIKRKVPKSVYKFPLPKAYGPPIKSVAEVDRGDPVKYGQYLAGPLGHCIECHTPMVKGRHDWKRLGAGGFPFKGPWGVSVSRNITSHPKFGLGGWTDAEIKRAVLKGVRKDGTRLKPPMAYDYYANISAADMTALVAYMRTIKPYPPLRK